MTERTIFECDVTGERYGAKNAGDGIFEFNIKRRGVDFPYQVTTETVHISNDVLFDEVDPNAVPNGIEYITVARSNGREEINGIVYEERSSMYGSMGKSLRRDERDNESVNHYEEFFEFVEDQILY